MFKKSMLSAVLLSTVLSSPSSAYFGESVINCAYDKASSAASWVKQNPGKTALGVAVLGAASYAAYWGYTSYKTPSNPGLQIDPKDLSSSADSDNSSNPELQIDPKDLPEIQKMIQDCTPNNKHSKYIVPTPIVIVPTPTDINFCLIKSDNQRLASQALHKYWVENGITSVDLSHKALNWEHAKILAAALPGSKLNTLKLSYNNIGDKGAKEIADALKKSELIDIGLSSNKIGNIGAQAIADALSKSQLTTLNFFHNNIGDEGAQKIAAALPQSQLTNLDLASNNIGDTGAEKIADALSGSKLEWLYLYSNNIGDIGAQKIADALSGSKLEWLYLSSNRIDNATKKIFNSTTNRDGKKISAFT